MFICGPCCPHPALPPYRPGLGPALPPAGQLWHAHLLPVLIPRTMPFPDPHDLCPELPTAGHTLATRATALWQSSWQRRCPVLCWRCSSHCPAPSWPTPAQPGTAQRWGLMACLLPWFQATLLHPPPSVPSRCAAWAGWQAGRAKGADRWMVGRLKKSQAGGRRFLAFLCWGNTQSPQASAFRTAITERFRSSAILFCLPYPSITSCPCSEGLLHPCRTQKVHALFNGCMCSAGPYFLQRLRSSCPSLPA